MDDWKLATSLLDRFEQGEIELPGEAQELVAALFRACGYPVTDTGFVESDRGADLFLDALVEGTPTRVAVEVKYRGRAADEASIAQLLAMRESNHVGRVIVVSRAGFTSSALRLARDNGVGIVDLLSPSDLRNWLAKHAPNHERRSSVELLIRTAMKALARQIAETPWELASVEWRDLERVLREVFEQLGFRTKLTRPGKDGGFDLELALSTETGEATYLVEVKHWADQKPGPKHLEKLVEVTASRQATGGVLLSTSGFSGTFYKGFARISAPIRIGDGAKVVALCKTYFRFSSEIWMEEPNPVELLLEGTQQPVSSIVVRRDHPSQ